jgi:peptidoglycan/LPS O-acetylase OafA/YrhL
MIGERPIATTPATETFVSRNISFFRWLSAAAVVVMHATALLLAQSDIMSAPHNLFEYFWWFVSSQEVGHKAVVGFFVISGYLVGGEAVRGVMSGEPFYYRYYLKRFARIYVVLVPALFFTFLIDTAGGALFGKGGFYGDPMFAGHFGFEVFTLNLLNLQNIFTQPYGSNIPLWSLAVEVWYYITFPLLLLPITRHLSARVRLFCFCIAIFVCGYFSLISYLFFWGYVMWISGAAAAMAGRPVMRSYWGALALFVVILIPVRLLVRGPLLEAFPSARTASDVVCALAFANLLLSARFSTPRLFGSLPNWRPNVRNFTFSLYVTHLPLIVFVRAGLESVAPGWALQNATLGNWATALSVIAGAGAFAFLFCGWTELRTTRFREFLARRLERLLQPFAPDVGRSQAGR